MEVRVRLRREHDIVGLFKGEDMIYILYFNFIYYKTNLKDSIIIHILLNHLLYLKYCTVSWTTPSQENTIRHCCCRIETTVRADVWICHSSGHVIA
jgi:hypothetical protein